MTMVRLVALSAFLAGTALCVATAPASARAAIAVTVARGTQAADCDDYYSPPWGYPADYCNYEVWDQPVYADGIWYNGPIYTRADGGVRWFWIRGRWRRHAWTGTLPAFRWGRAGFVNWHGKSVRGKYQWRFGSRHNWRGRGHGNDRRRGQGHRRGNNR
jgi:hypothetical protein